MCFLQRGVQATLSRRHRRSSCIVANRLEDGALVGKFALDTPGEGHSLDGHWKGLCEADDALFALGVRDQKAELWEFALPEAKSGRGLRGVGRAKETRKQGSPDGRGGDRFGVAAVAVPGCSTFAAHDRREV